MGNQKETQVPILISMHVYVHQELRMRDVTANAVEVPVLVTIILSAFVWLFWVTSDREDELASIGDIDGFYWTTVSLIPSCLHRSVRRAPTMGF